MCVTNLTAQSEDSILFLWKLFQCHAHTLNGAHISNGVLLVGVAYKVRKASVLPCRLVSALFQHHAAFTATISAFV
jgi:hypothetical protein